MSHHYDLIDVIPEKYYLSIDLDDHDYRGIFDDNGRIIIDNQIANILCRLSLKEEYFFIDNDYKLSMKGIKRRDI